MLRDRSRSRSRPEQLRMAVVTSIVFLLVVSVVVQGQTFPTLPEIYSVDIQWNQEISERTVAGAGASADDDRGKVIAGWSASIVERAAGRDVLAIDHIQGYHEDHEMKSTHLRILWDEAIEGINQYLYEEVTFPEEEIVCVADYVLPNDFLFYWLLHGNPDKPTIPSIMQFLNRGQYNFVKGDTVNGVKVHLFQTAFKIDSVKASFNVQYYWSDPAIWNDPVGRNLSMPVQAIIEGEGQFMPSQPDKMVQFSAVANFMHFDEAMADEEFFMPPKNYFCEGRIMDKKVPDTSSYAFKFNSELIYHYKRVDTSPLKIVVPREEWYDYAMHVSRTDYKTLDPSNPDDPFGGTYGFVSEVKDFISNFVYRTSQTYGNCSIEHLGWTPSGDIIHGPGGTIHMASPFEFFHLGQKYASNGAHKERGMVMDYFVSEVWQGQTSDNDQSGLDNYTTILAYASPDYEVEDASTDKERNMLVRMERYSNTIEPDPTKRIISNIVGFQNSPQDFQDFDIRACFKDDEMDHRVIRLGYREDVRVYDDLRYFRDQVRVMATVGAQVYPIRIQDIDLDVKTTEKAIYATITLVGPPKVDMPDDVPEGSKRPLKEAVNYLKAYIKAGNFTIDAHIDSGRSDTNKDDELLTLKADPDFFQSVDRKATNKNQSPTSSTGYSGGAMAGMAFGMLALGLVISGALYFFVLRNRVRSTLPTQRSYANPIQDIEFSKNRSETRIRT